MNTKRFSLFFCLLCCFCMQVLFAGAQDTDIQDTGAWSQAELDKANTAADVPYMSAEEKKALQLMNLARMDGERFFDAYIGIYLEQHNEKYIIIREDNKYVLSLQKDLLKVKNLPLLYPDESLYKAAAYHAEDLGKTGGVGHDSSNGDSFAERIVKFSGSRFSKSENCSYGFSDALGIVGQLLVDNGVVSLGHRVNILRKESCRVGIAIRPHQKWGANCVMDFSSEPLPVH